MASIRYTLDSRLAKAFTQALRMSPAGTREELMAATLEALSLLENLAKDNTPVGATGLLRGAWAHELLGAPADDTVLGSLYNPLGYAAPVEHGTRPHWAPLDPLIDWVRAKLNVKDEDEARHVARLIQFKIAARGTEGAKMATRALDTALEDIKRMYEQARVRSFQRIG